MCVVTHISIQMLNYFRIVFKRMFRFYCFVLPLGSFKYFRHPQNSRCKVLGFKNPSRGKLVLEVSFAPLVFLFSRPIQFYQECRGFCQFLFCLEIPPTRRKGYARISPSSVESEKLRVPPLVHCAVLKLRKIVTVRYQSSPLLTPSLLH